MIYLTISQLLNILAVSVVMFIGCGCLFVLWVRVFFLIILEHTDKIQN